jgi:hypothetical protein
MVALLLDKGIRQRGILSLTGALYGFDFLVAPRDFLLVGNERQAAT